MRGRQSQAMLRTLGVDELVTASTDAYVETAVALGGDADRRRDLSRRIVARRDALFEREEPVRALEDFLEKAARG
jgi:predicted O-linked N-acetylglucosamine transferase (SPINDLY family)